MDSEMEVHTHSDSEMEVHTHPRIHQHAHAVEDGDKHSSCAN